MGDQQTEVLRGLREGDVATVLQALGWHADPVPLRGAAWRAWGWFGRDHEGALISQQTGCRTLAIEGALDRSLVRSVARHAPLDTVLWFFVEADTVTFAVAHPEDDEWRLRTLELRREAPAPMALERLLRLDRAEFARPELDFATAARQHVAEVLDQEVMTRQFFKGFSDALRTMAESVQGGPRSAEQRWHCALIVLLRLIFLYFLQRDGLLDGDRRYVVRRLRKSDGRFFDDTLRPLFFGVLNTPAAQRSAAARNLGDVPFLNGGLFDPTPLEIQYPMLSWSDEVCSSVIEGLFERFHFTASEPAGDDVSCTVDPEMLGKVFEGLMFGDDRRNSGAFYTPRDVVAGMVETAISGYVADQQEAGIPEEVALEHVRILDPAVGTGAFLLEALSQLRQRRQALGLRDTYADVRQLVHDHLYGVDVNHTAVRLCELRIWLVMLTLMREHVGPMEPLPNLSHRVVAGDSLLDEVQTLRRNIRVSHDELRAIQQGERELEDAQRVFFAAHGHAKIAARRTLHDAERALEHQLLQGRRQWVQQQLAPLRLAVESRDLFGETSVCGPQAQAIAALEDELRELDRATERATFDERPAPGFSYATRFGAAGREGFDIIVTNPPWVRSQRLDRATRDALASRYATAGGTLWAGAAELGIRTPYGAQPDLAALFVERSLELLKPGGRLAALIPAKLFRTLHAAPMRRLLCKHGIHSIEDLSDAQRQLFDATVYPGILHVQKDRAVNENVSLRVWRGDQVESSQGLDLTTGAAGAPWFLAPRPVTEILARVQEHSVPLGHRADCEPARGIFTGANNVFIRPVGGFVREFGRDVEGFVRPLLRGSGLGEAPTSEILWCYEGAAPSEVLPPALVRYFERNRDTLERRSDHRPELPLWQMFRVRADEDRPRVAWRDMSVFLDPVVVAAGPVAANTVYYVPFDELEDALGFARWMSSLPVRALAYGLAERARGGWRRHFAWVIRMLPVPVGMKRWRDFDPDAHSGLHAEQLAVLERWLLVGLRKDAS